MDSKNFYRTFVAFCLTVIIIFSSFSFILVSRSIAYASRPNSSVTGPILTPSIVPPVNTGVLKDPTGTYTFTYLGNGSFTMNYSAYEKLLQDPYTGIGSGSDVTVEGNTVIITPPESDTVSYTNDVNDAWSGAGGGDCGSFSASDGNAICNNPSGSLGTTGVYFSSVTWDPTCFSGTSCVTSFWTGLSPLNTGDEPLLQNGINVCENLGACPGGGTDKKTTWDMWWLILGQESSDQVISVYPTSINGTNYEFNAAFVNSDTQPTFAWTVGSWYYSLTESSKYTQNYFWISEGIMEPPLYDSARQVLLDWSPNPNGMTGWWETGQWCGCTYNSGYYGSSYTPVLFTVDSSSGGTEAYGSITGSTAFSDTFV